MSESIKRAAEAVSGADAVLITAGAGIGVDSGLPDFRGNQGFWQAYPPIKKLGISFVEMANPHWFNKDPRLAWAFYGHRLQLYRDTVPHNGFMILQELTQTKKAGHFVFTSNVDGQFQKAGFNNDSILECHGSIHHLQCVQPCNNHIWDCGDTRIEIDIDTFKAISDLPRCPACAQLARPNILMFGDWSWIHHRTSEQERKYEIWLENIISSNYKLAIIELGAGNAVATVRMQSEYVARQCRGTLIRINPRDSFVSDGHISIECGALEGLSKIKNYLR